MNEFNQPIFIDSGAHGIYNEFVRNTAKPKKYEYYQTDDFWKYVDKYAEFIKANEHIIELYANVDAITNPEITWKVQLYLEKEHGLSPLPVIHHGTDLKWLQRYLNRGYKYIALGGVGQGVGRSDYYGWADNAFSIICNTPAKTPSVKVHGFAVTSFTLMSRYPWYSVDSTSWLKYASYGYVMYPVKRNNKWRYDLPFSCFRISSRVHTSYKHFESSITEQEDSIFYDYIKERGYKIGYSIFKTVSSAYKRQENELWVDKDKKIVEVIKEQGLINNSDLRCEINALYYVDFVKHLPEWPWSWQNSNTNQKMIFK